MCLSGLCLVAPPELSIPCKRLSGAQQYHLRDIAERKEKTLRKVTLIGACAFGGLVCTLLAPQAQAQGQLTLHKNSATITVSESSLNFSDTLLLPQFQKIVHNANASLYAVDIQEITNASIFGTVTNNTGASKTFSFEAGMLTNSTLPSVSTLSTSALALKTLTLAGGGTFAYTTGVSGLGDSGPLTSNLSVYQGTGTFATAINGSSIVGFNNANGLSSTLGASSTAVTEKVTYWYYAPFTPVPELGTPISLGLMGLVGGALGLCARRRAR
jgi:hypothetical protein